MTQLVQISWSFHLFIDDSWKSNERFDNMKFWCPWPRSSIEKHRQDYRLGHYHSNLWNSLEPKFEVSVPNPKGRTIQHIQPYATLGCQIWWSLAIPQRISKRLLWWVHWWWNKIESYTFAFHTGWRPEKSCLSSVEASRWNDLSPSNFLPRFCLLPLSKDWEREKGAAFTSSNDSSKIARCALSINLCLFPHLHLQRNYGQWLVIRWRYRAMTSGDHKHSISSGSYHFNR